MALTGKRPGEAQIVQEVSAESVWQYADYIAEEDRLSGSEGEARAVRYFKKLMEDWGLEVKILQIENFISLPIRASLRVLRPEQKPVPCITHSFSISTPPGGLEGELVYVGAGSDQDVRGKIVLREGLASPAPTWALEQRGAIGQVCINSGDLPRNMIITTIWGHPTPESANRIPNNAVVSMNKAGGDYLKALCQKGPVRIRLETEVWTGFKPVPLALADLKSPVEPDKYVLFNGHIESWHRGASDNGTANACMLEVARLLARHRAELRRSVRFAWWSGHSHGRYSGSTWYVDHNWEDLYKNAVANVNVDSLGCQGATDYSEVESMAELYELGRDVIQEYTGQNPHYARIGRSGDQSFWGVGMPSLFQLLSRQPSAGSGADVLISGLAWFWHTEADTIDKIDRNILLKDTQVYTATLWRLATAPVLPFTFGGVADEFLRHLSALQEKAGGAFDLGPARERAEALKSKAKELQRACEAVTERVASRSGADAAGEVQALNRCMMQVSRVLVPVNYSAVDRFELDAAVPVPALPGLQRVATMASMDRGSWDFKFLERKMVRERNKVCHALDEAVALIEEVLSRVKP
jgi:hypothetical protein